MLVSEAPTAAEPTRLQKVADTVWEILLKLKRALYHVIKCVVFSKPLKLLVKLPWMILIKIPIFKILNDHFENMHEILHTENNAGEEEDEETGHQKPQLMEEIAIPSVTQLVKAGVHFTATNGGISSIKFDNKTLTLHIPVIKLNMNSVVVLRNLVAYEACSTPGPLVLARYTELMNGIIDTEEDAKYLSRKGIILNYMKSDKEVADMWNGMSNSVRSTKVPSLDKAIVDVNKFYNQKWRVKIGKFMKEYVFGSWKGLTFITAIVMLFLVFMQNFCAIYSCARILRIEGLEPVNPNVHH